MNRLTMALSLSLLAAPAAAEMRIDFKEGAPKDRFILTNVGACALPAMAVTIDMGESQGRLVFDVTESGAGVEVFQPFEVEVGADYLTTLPEVIDGQTQVTLDLTPMDIGARLVVSTDLDDTIGAREITVRGSEFQGTTLSIAMNGTVERATFTQATSLVAARGAC